MTRKNTFYSVLIILSSLFVTVGCSNNGINSNFDADEIEIKVIESSKQVEGNNYALKLKNLSSHVIKQNTVFISYPIKDGNGVSWNKCKTEATGNKLNIQPMEEVSLNVFVEKENYENNKMIDTENLHVQIEGYIDDVMEINHFDRVSELKP